MQGLQENVIILTKLRFEPVCHAALSNKQHILQNGWLCACTYTNTQTQYNLKFVNCVKFSSNILFYGSEAYTTKIDEFVKTSGQ